MLVYRDQAGRQIGRQAGRWADGQASEQASKQVSDDRRRAMMDEGRGDARALDINSRHGWWAGKQAI